MKKITKNVLSLALLLTVLGLPLLVGAQTQTGGFNATAGYDNTNLSTASLYDTLVNILNILLGIIAVLAVLGFVISGIMFITAGGSSERAESAKSWLIYSIVGVAVALIGYIVVGFVSTLLKTT